MLHSSLKLSIIEGNLRETALGVPPPRAASNHERFGLSMATPDFTTKRCTKCGVEYPATREYFHKNKDSLHPRCKVCHRAYAAAWYAAHREEKLAYSVAYASAHREEKLAYKAAYDATHREENRAYKAAYDAEHPEKQRAITRNYRARKRVASGTHTAADVIAQLKRQKGRCYYAACGHCKLGDNYHVEHVVPLIRKGRNAPDNLVISCPTCNLKKHNKLPHEWVEGGRLL